MQLTAHSWTALHYLALHCTAFLSLLSLPLPGPSQGHAKTTHSCLGNLATNTTHLFGEVIYRQHSSVLASHLQTTHSCLGNSSTHETQLCLELIYKQHLAALYCQHTVVFGTHLLKHLPVLESHLQKARHCLRNSSRSSTQLSWEVVYKQHTAV